MRPSRRLVWRIASTEEEFEAIHRLNQRTFAGEIPQHAPDPSGRLVDRFHAENTYAVCLDGDRLVGMLAGRSRRPFSLDAKVRDLDALLPPGRRPVEIRLLAVEPGYRGGPIVARLVGLLSERFRAEGCDCAVISGITSQERLYRHIGFEPVGGPVGSGAAVFQPMVLTLERYLARGRAFLRPRNGEARRPALFLPGPVRVRPEVRRAFRGPPLSHRSAAYAALLDDARRRLVALTGAAGATVLVGSGTLANDAVAGRISLLGTPGMVLANGEFGDRLIDHAERWGLRFEAVRAAWGEPFEPAAVRTAAAALPAGGWIWAVHGETSTGVRNDLPLLRAVSAQRGLALCLDAVSTVGTLPVDLRGVRFATCTSGKGIGAYPGLGIVLHDGSPMPPAPGRLPRYLDLGAWEEAGGVLCTGSSNLLEALVAALGRPDWPGRLARIEAAGRRLRQRLREEGLRVVAAEAAALPAVTTVELPEGVEGPEVLESLRAEGLELHGDSGYLARRRWLQVGLMGEWEDADLERVPAALAGAARRAAAT